MSVKKFKFISPGIFLNEIDNSQLPKEAAEIGPVIIGRTVQGPAMRPVTVSSFEEFVNVFGTPNPGGKGVDVWRNGNLLTPTYASYAAQAWLKNSSTVTVVRLLGKAHDQATLNTGEAGWKTANALGTDNTSSVGGAFGLWVFPSEISASGATVQATGSLAAIWYVNEGSVGLKGLTTQGTTTNFGQAQFVASDASGKFTVVVTSSDNSSGQSTTQKEIKFSFTDSDKDFVRKVFNTNPALVNEDITATSTKEVYWLGETFENDFSSLLTGSGTTAPASSTGLYWGVVLGIGANNQSSVNYQHQDQRNNFINSETGWFISQDLSNNTGSYDPANMQKLFKFVGLEHGDWVQKNIKISIANIKDSSDQFNKYGTFDVLIRRINDSDKSVVLLERFSNCTLNPNSEDYIARKIGDKFMTFDVTQRRLKESGTYPNLSKYVRVKMDTDVDAASTNPEYLPFGVFGPVKYKDFSFTTTAPTVWSTGSAFAWGGTGTQKIEDLSVMVSSSALPATSSFLFKFPEVQLRTNTSQDNLSDYSQAFFGAWTGKSSTTNKFNEDIHDLVRPKALAINTIDVSSTNVYLEHMWVFSLDDISGSTDAGFTYAAGTRAAGTSTRGSGSYETVLDLDINSFTAVLYGGSDGFDVTEKEPLRNGLVDGNVTERTSYEYNTYKEAIDILKDPEFIEFNLITIPGLSEPGLTDHLLETVEARGDALAIIDLENDYHPAYEDDAGALVGDVTQAIASLKERGINNSYGAAYYPWVQVRDTLEGNLVYMPPSVVALGAMSYTDRVRAPWFAPAGFNRGGLTSGVAGLPVVNITQKLTAKERDLLYNANVNPIASFPSEGIVIFGQKTLQVTRSALDRVNVRRLLLFVKKGISRIAASDLLFEPNIRETWDKFTARANPFLADVKARFGLTDYKLVLDETTTTPDLVDQNILYAKVMLKPAKAIEFIPIDFVIDNSGVGFDD